MVNTHGHPWRSALVRPAGGGDRRRPADVVRLVAGSVVAAALFALRLRAPVSDRSLVYWFQDLGLTADWIGTASRLLLIGAVPALIVLIALGTRSWRLLGSATTAAVTAAAVAIALGPLTSPSAERQASLDALGVTAWFPVVVVAVPVALLTVSQSFLARPARRALGLLFALGTAAFVASVQALVVDVTATAFAGWAAAGLAGLVFGTPVGDPTAEQVSDDLTRLGVPPTEVVPAGHPVWGTARFRSGRSSATAGCTVVDVHGSEAQEARALQRLWHGLVDRHRNRVAVGRFEQAEHEALALVLAERAGVAAPRLVAVGGTGAADDAYVVTHDPGGTALRDLPPEQVTDEVLASVWTAVSACRAGGLAHGLLDGASIEVCDDGSAQLTDWMRADPSGEPGSLDRDVATTLLVTAACTDAPRAVRAAIDGIGGDAVATALPLLQLGVLDRRARHDVDKQVATAVRDEAAQALGIEAPELAELHRVSPGNLAMIAGTLLGFWLLYGQLASLDGIWSTVADADWAWAVLVLLFAQVAVVFTAVGLRGAVVPHLPLGQVIALEYADLFTGLVGGTVAITATNIRYFQRQGLPAASAVTSGVVSSLAGGLIQAVIIVVSIPLLLRTGAVSMSSSGGGAGGGRLLVATIIAVAVISGVVALVPRFRGAVMGKVRPQLDKARDDLRGIAQRPRKVATMFGGMLCSQLAMALALGASLAAFGGSLPFFQLLAVNTVAALIGGLAPVPGGMGAVEAGLIGGLTALGVDATLAGAATFTFRLFTAYLPPAWGWPILVGMRRRELL